jgi:hypothetical protein
LSFSAVCSYPNFDYTVRVAIVIVLNSRLLVKTSVQNSQRNVFPPSLHVVLREGQWRIVDQEFHKRTAEQPTVKAIEL